MKKSMKVIYTVIILSFLFLNSGLLAQNKPEKVVKSDADKIVLKLQQKVLLTAEQSEKVKSIVNSYLDGDKSSENLVEAQRKIEALFDAKQKAKYDIIKVDWWKSVNKGTR